ncbi:MAG: peptidylprolyl isomerase [Candidatus Micrarchaeota archaeon]|nr:peptidylprolyl isomerase [Candidatus Micrarchaeota archaeon]
MANAKKGDLVKLEYTGRLAKTGQVFDTTDESIAKKAGIWESSSAYGPKHALFGSGAIIPGMEEAVLQCQLGKTEDFAIEPKKAFGERDNALVRMIAEKEFRKQQVQPQPGMMVTLDGAIARVKSVTSGRVVIDYNHPLAGEQVVYSIKVHEIITDDRKKIEAILSSNALSGDISQGAGGKLMVTLKGAPPEKAEAARRTISAVVPGTEVKSA